MPEVIRIEDQHVLVPTKNYPYGAWTYENFNQVQSRLIEVYENDSNIAIAASTSAGKTICSEIYAAYEIRKNKGKAIYIAPMKSLAKEKEGDWTDAAHHFKGLKVSICTGDFRVTTARIKELEEADVIVMTPEMLASRARNCKSEKSSFLKNVKVIIFDESHLLTVPSRGDHIEIALMKMTEINPEVRVVLLSATMPNVDEICHWICKLTNRDTYFLESTYRPCPLGIHYEKYYDGDRRYEDKEKEKVSRALGILEYYTDDKFLVFVHSKKTGKMFVEYLKKRGIESEFHNADLTYEKRMSLEKKFKAKDGLRVIVATSTLAWGVNLPCRRVIIVGVDRGLQPVENYDIWQMVGRAGRPAYDPRGDAYILVPESRANEVIAKLKVKEPIRSQLLEDIAGHHKTLAFHVVSEIHHGNINTKDAFHKWFRRSLAHHQNHSFNDAVVDKVIDLLVKCRAVEAKGDEYKATSIGMVASMFYYSPFDVADLKNNFKNLFEKGRQENDVALAVALGNLDSNRFGIVNKDDKAEMAVFQQKAESLLGKGAITDSCMRIACGYYNMLNGIENSAFASLQAGLRVDCDRTLEVLGAIDTISAKWGQTNYFRSLRMRLAYGVGAHLVELCNIPNIGKVRAEKLYKANIRTVDDFAKQDVDKLSLIANLSKDKTQESLDEAKMMKLRKLI